MQIAEYLKPGSLPEAHALLTAHGKNHIYGGGAWIKLTLKHADRLISLEKIGLDTIEEKHDHIDIGAMVTLREIETNPLVKELYGGILANACHSIMGITIRNIATLGGSVMGRLAFSDIFPALLAMNAHLIFYKAKEISVEEFLEKPLKEKDILVAIRIQKKKADGFFKKVATTPLDFAIINFAITNGDDGYRIAIGSTPYIASCAKAAMAHLNALKTVTDNEIDKAVELTLSEIRVSDNVRGSKAYRIELIKAYVKRGIRQVTQHVG